MYYFWNVLLFLFVFSHRIYDFLFLLRFTSCQAVTKVVGEHGKLRLIERGVRLSVGFPYSLYSLCHDDEKEEEQKICHGKIRISGLRNGC